MKNKNLQLLVFATLLISILNSGFSSCNKPNDEPGTSAQFSATINGESFNPILVAAWSQMDMITISGLMPKSADTFQLQLSFMDTVSVNSKLTFKNDEAILYHINYTKGAPTYSSWAWYAHGTVTFTTVDKTNKKIAGNFNGVLYKHTASLDSLVITDGQFNTTYK